MGRRNKYKQERGAREEQAHGSRVPARYIEFTEDELKASRPPAWAKGRVIGLWHAQKQRKKKDEEDESCIPLSIDDKKLCEIERIVKGLAQVAPPLVAISAELEASERYRHVEESAFKRKFLSTISGLMSDKANAQTFQIKLNRNTSEDDSLLRKEKMKQSDSRVRDLMQFRVKLPAWSHKSDILAAVANNQVIVVSGETGCGKTTQVAQFILEEAILSGNGSLTHIVCTQPRRISALSVAERVADERGERVGESVGYQIRLEKMKPRPSGSLLFCTTGVLLQLMHGDPFLTQVSHVIIDEIHERDTVSDFILTLLKEVIPVRPDLKVILMSATLNADKFSRYFNNCPTLHIPGFTFPVKTYYLEDVLELVPFSFDNIRNKRPLPKNKKKRSRFESKSQEEMTLEAFYRDLERSGRFSKRTIESIKHPESEETNVDLIAQLLHHICTYEGPGAVLIFLPGWDKINKLNSIIKDSGRFPTSRYLIIPLHSLMPTVKQREIFDRPPPGVRKIVIATNIAETSITIDDVVYVIDCGKIKIRTFDAEDNVSSLNEHWVSLANAKQRRGRAGRVQAGVCYHLFSRGREMLLDSYMLPEMLRTRLEEVILQGKILQVGKIGPFLQKVLDPPLERSVEVSLELLKGMNALDDQENLTPLGFHLGNLPVDPQAGKMLLFAAMFSALDPIASIAASLSFKDAFHIPLGMEREVDRIKSYFDDGQCSDHMVMARVVSGFEEAKQRGDSWNYVRSNFLSHSTLEQLNDMKSQFAKLLYDMRYLDSRDYSARVSNINSSNTPLVKAIVCAGLYPNIGIIRKASIKGGRATSSLKAPDDQKLQFHPKSVLSKVAAFDSKFFVYFEKIRSTQTFVHDATLAFSLPLIFFCQNLKIQARGEMTEIQVASKIRFLCPPRLAKLVLELRDWLDWLLEYKVAHPGVTDWSHSSVESQILRAIMELISHEEQMHTNDSGGEDSDTSI